MLGLLHATLRTALLAHELINKQNRTLHVALGTRAESEALRSFGDRAKVVQYLKLGGRFLGFDVDDRFSNVLEGLILGGFLADRYSSANKIYGG